MPPADPRKDYPAGYLIPGTVYKVLRHIATGGMGTVYDIEDTTVGKRYVLKTLHPELGERQDLTRRMIKEARMLAQLHHPNIVEVFTAGMTGDALRLPYYVMERLDGSSLRTVLEKRKSLELPHAYEIAIDLLDALDCAHDKQVIHRDVKPDNIFLHRSQNGATVTKLLDFGIMRVLDGAKGETQGRFLGTLRYAAPEQLRGDDIGPHTDLYAAGLVLYEMICGRGPFDNERDIHQIGKAHLTRAAPPLAAHAKVPVPPELEALVASALAKDWRMRPRDAFTFAKELRGMAQALKGGSAELNGPTSMPTAVNVLAAPSAPQVQVIVGGGHAAAMAAPATAAMGPASMGPATNGGATREDAAPAGAHARAPEPPYPGTLASAGQSSPPSAGPGVDRKAATRSLVYEQPQGAPRDGTEAITPPIAVTLSADPYGMTQQALEAPPVPRPIEEVPPIVTQGNWQSDRGAPLPLETTSPTSRRHRSAVLAFVGALCGVIALGSLAFIAVRARRQGAELARPALVGPVVAPPVLSAPLGASAPTAAAAPTASTTPPGTTPTTAPTSAPPTTASPAVAAAPPPPPATPARPRAPAPASSTKKQGGQPWTTVPSSGL